MAVYGLTNLSGTLVALPAATTTYLCGVVSGSATQDAAITWLDVTFDAGTPAQGIKIELVRFTGGIPTGTSYTPNRLSGDAQATASAMASAWVAPLTATPTGPTVIKTWCAQPGGGVLIQSPLKREDNMPAGASNWVAVRVTTASGVSPNCAFNLSWDE
jgi:hypothetical protein